MVADPALIFSGLMDVPRLKIGSATTTFELSVESRAARMKMARNRRYTDEDQQWQYPGDKGFQYVTRIQGTFTWGAATAAFPGSGGGAGGALGGGDPGGDGPRPPGGLGALE